MLTATALPTHTLNWRNSFAALGASFATRLLPTALPQPYWVGHNLAMAHELGLDRTWLASNDACQVFTGNRLLPGMQSLASVYSGHQFGQWAGQLGDGRAILLGELQDQRGQWQEIQLKGAGQTPYSRMGDGRAVLRSSIREFLCSEAMHALGIPTSRALCITGSDAPVMREALETAAVVTRVAPSFIRFGHFEHFAYTGQQAQLKQLADYVIDGFYPACREATNPYADLLRSVTLRTAELMARWQAAGFCHGVMNTDNMSILGLTIDYGPFQFLDGFNPGHICNHSDTQGRYAYNQQPNVAFWNLFCLGQALLPLVGETDTALAALEPYKTRYPQALLAAYRAKLGLTDQRDSDHLLVESVLKLLAKEHTDYPIFWRHLSQAVASQVKQAASTHSFDAVRDLFIDRAPWDAWLPTYLERLATRPFAQTAQLMLQSNPRYVLRNHLGEQAIQKAKSKDFSMLANLLAVLQSPFDEHPDFQAWAGFPPDWASQIEISCSS
ncbi:MAG: protein adenylyltransferase SelO [Burkholderiales bacterium]